MHVFFPSFPFASFSCFSSRFSFSCHTFLPFLFFVINRSLSSSSNQLPQVNDGYYTITGDSSLFAIMLVFLPYWCFDCRTLSTLLLLNKREPLFKFSLRVVVLAMAVVIIPTRMFSHFTFHMHTLRNFDLFGLPVDHCPTTFLCSAHRMATATVTVTATTVSMTATVDTGAVLGVTVALRVVMVVGLLWARALLSMTLLESKQKISLFTQTMSLLCWKKMTVQVIQGF